MDEEKLQMSVKKSKKKSGKNFIIFILLILLASSLFGAYYFYSKYNKIKNNPNIESQEEVDKVLSKVSKLMIVPTDDEPSVATVLDKSKLTGQAFFTSVENGDKLLIFPKNMQAIIYRPSQDKIIKVGPIFLNPNNSASDVVDQNTDVSLDSNINLENTIKIAYYNGTDVNNLSAQTENAVKSKFPDFETIKLANASKNDYKQTMVVDISGGHDTEISQIASLLDAQILESLPEGEIVVDADILIISGQ